MDSSKDTGKGKFNPMKIARLAVRWLLPLALTVLMVTYLFRKVDFTDMWRIMSHGVDYWWILLAMILSVFSHIFRALRWRLQLRSLGINAPIMALSCSIFGCYALNLVFPRLGEVWRCTYIAKREKASFTTVLGSMVADRFSDALCGGTLLVLAFIVATPAIESFLERYPVGQNILDSISSPWFWTTVVGSIMLIWAIFYFGRGAGPIRKMRSWVSETWEGFASLRKIKEKWVFVGLSACIWGCYYLQLYVAFYAFPFTRELCSDPNLAFGLIPALVAFVLSSVGMAIPSNGGLGPWNIAVMFGLAIYGISTTDGTAFSMLSWSGQTVMLIIVGIFTMLYITLDGRKKKTSR